MAFRLWIRQNRNVVKKLALKRVIALYGKDISLSGAYRAAVAEGLRGRRLNGTRYERFWSALNWRLPDSTLSEVWGVFRGNIRHRRVRLGIGDAEYDRRHDRHDSRFRDEVRREERRAASFDGPRPT